MSTPRRVPKSHHAPAAAMSTTTMISGSGFLIGERFAYIVAKKHVADVGVHSARLNTEHPRDKDGTRQMKRLSADENRGDAENIAGAIHAAVSVEACVVEEYDSVRYTFSDEIQARRIYLVLNSGAVVARDKDP